MPRFYFHLHDDLDVPDDEGEELPDLKAALAHATCQVRVLAAEMAKEQGRIVLHHRIDIENDQGEVLATVHFRDALVIEE